jgi:hypothetical protein
MTPAMARESKLGGKQTKIDPNLANNKRRRPPSIQKASFCGSRSGQSLAAAHQVNSLGFASIGEKQLGNLCRSKAGLARNERFDRVGYSDEVPATVFQARNRSFAHLHDASTRGRTPKEQEDGTRAEPKRIGPDYHLGAASLAKLAVSSGERHSAS